MLLAKIMIDSRHPSARQGLYDRQDLHRNLTQAFSGKFLYRLTKNNDTLGLLVLCDTLPDETILRTKGCLLEQFQDVSALKTIYADGSLLRFNLLASPSKKLKEDGKDNSRRVFLSSMELRSDWLKRQGVKYGFEVLEVHEPSVPQILTVGRASGAFSLSAVEFEGIIRIRNCSVFWPSWEKGIGPEKAYGMGLMLLSR